MVTIEGQEKTVMAQSHLIYQEKEAHLAG